MPRLRQGPTFITAPGQLPADAQELMRVMLFWNHETPSNWVQIPRTRDRRIAVQIPVRSSDLEAPQSASGQSVCVRGYGTLVVNSQLKSTAEDPVSSLLKSDDPESGLDGSLYSGTLRGMMRLQP